MSHIIPTPLFEKTDETKRLFIKSLSLDERNVNGSVKDDFMILYVNSNCRSEMMLLLVLCMIFRLKMKNTDLK